MAGPSLKEIGELVSTLEQEWDPLKALDTTRTDFYLGQHQIEVPDLKILGVTPEAVTANTGMEVIRRLKGLFGYGQYQVNPSGNGAEPRREAEKFATFLNSIFPCLEDITQEDTWDLIKEDILRLGRAWSLTLPLFKRYTKEYGYPQRDDFKNDRTYNKNRAEWVEVQKPPISHRHIAASDVMALLTGDVGVERGVVVNLSSGARLKRLWPDASVVKAMGQEEEAKKYRIVTYVDATYCTYAYLGEKGAHLGPVSWGVKGGELLDSWPHKMGVCPLVLHVGQLTSDPRLEYRFRCVIDDILGIGVALDRLWTRQLTQVKIDGLNFMYIEAKAGSGVDQREVINLDTSGPLALREGEKPGRFPTSPVSPEGESLYAKMIQQKERLALTDVMRGLGGKDQSGISYKLMRDAAQSEWTPVGGHMADGRRRQAQMVGRAVMALDEAVYVRNSTKDGTERIGCTPELAKDRLEDIHIMLNPEFPEDRVGDLDATAKALELGLPPTWAYENLLNEPEPQKVQDQAAIERIVAAATEQLIQEAIDRMKIARQQAAIATPLQVQEAMPTLSPGLQQAIQGMGQPPPAIGPEGLPVTPGEVPGAVPEAPLV